MYKTLIVITGMSFAGLAGWTHVPPENMHMNHFVTNQDEQDGESPLLAFENEKDKDDKENNPTALVCESDKEGSEDEVLA